MLIFQGVHYKKNNPGFFLSQLHHSPTLHDQQQHLTPWSKIRRYENHWLWYHQTSIAWKKQRKRTAEIAGVGQGFSEFVVFLFGCLENMFSGKKNLWQCKKKCIHIKHVLHYETKKKLVSSYDRPIWIVSFKFKTRFEAILDCVERIVLLNHQFSHMRWAVRSFTNCSDLLLGRWIKPIDFSQYQ